MNSNQEAKLIQFGVFTLAQAKRIGLMQPAISRLAKSGVIQRVARGAYIHPKSKMAAGDISFQIAKSKFGEQSAIGGLSALFHYNLIEQVPQQIWVTVPPRTETSERLYRLIRTKLDSNIGVLDANGYRIASIERAILEALKFSTKIGEGIALRAARTAIAKKMTTLAKIGRTAKELGLQKVLTKYFEAIAS
jgi:predicted transcriptional regulator of viral defense system